MNIFVLDRDPEIAAQMLCDKHVVKMALETAQILSTINGGPYKPTHENHPCVKWAEKSLSNYKWLALHGIGICNEYTYRHDRTHQCEEVIYCLSTPLVLTEEIPELGLTDFVQCMPDIHKTSDPVQAYRNYYKSKSSFAKWSKRETPTWWLETESAEHV